MTSTNHLAITLVEQAQAQKEVTVNQALVRIDAFLNTGAKSRTTNAPPGSPASGDLYIVGAAPTGVWTGQAGKLAYYDQNWQFITPAEGITLWVNDEDLSYTYNGASWAATAGRTITGGGGITVANGNGVSGNPTLGISAKRTHPVPAAQMRPSATGGCAALALVATSANRPDLSTLDFDAATIEYAQFWLPMPKGWNEGTVTAQFLWSHAAAVTNFGVVWGMQAVAVSDGELIDAAYGTAQTVTDTGGVTNNLYISPETAAITIAGSPADGDMVCFRVYREATNGSDNLAVDAKLHAVKLYYTINTLDDA